MRIQCSIMESLLVETCHIVTVIIYCTVSIPYDARGTVPNIWRVSTLSSPLHMAGAVEER